jgi:DNA-binding CsgD family transcriptional regulator
VLVERDDELTAVQAALRDAESGTGSVLAITGPLGVGRSRLLREVSCRGAGAGALVLRARGALPEQHFAFGAVGQLFELVLAGASEQTRARWWSGPAALARFMFPAKPPYLSTRFPLPAHTALLHGLRTLLANISAERTVLMLVDDLQWVDPPSLKWLGHLARNLDGLRAVLVVSAREGDHRPVGGLLREIIGAASPAMRLQGLSCDGTRTLVCDRFGEPGDAEFVRACHEVSGGNPMILRALLDDLAVADARPLADQAPVVRRTRPFGLCERLLACLDSQTPEARGIVRAVAVLGDHVGVDEIGSVTGLDSVTLEQELDTLRRLGLLGRGSPPRPVHPALYTAVERAMTAAELEELHVRAAQLLHHRGSPAEQVAEHLAVVTSPQGPWAVDVLREASRTALGGAAYRRAARHLRRALLHCPPDAADRPALLVDLATAERGFDKAACVRHLSQAVPLLTSARDRAAAAVGLAPTTLTMCPESVITQIRKAARDMELCSAHPPGDLDLALRLEARRRYLDMDNPEELNACVDRLRRLGPNPPLETRGERELVTVLLYGASLDGEMGAGEVADFAHRILDREAPSAEHVDTALPLLVVPLVTADSPDRILSWLNGLRQQIRHLEVTRTLVDAAEAVALMLSGSMTRAPIRAQAAANAASMESDLFSSALMMQLAHVALEARNGQLTDSLLDIVRVRNQPLGLSVAQQMLRCCAATRQGDHASALQHAMDCGWQLQRAGWRNPAVNPWRGVAASLLHQLGRREESEELIEEEYKLAAAWGAPGALGRALRVRGTLGEGARGITLLREATQVLAESSNRLEQAKAHFVLGNRLRAAGEADAGSHLEQAQLLATLCGVRWPVEQAGVDLSVNVPQPDPATGSVLTGTDQRVARLAAEGRTNQQIADENGVTSRSVEKRLTKIYRMLGISGRTELAGALRMLDAPPPTP